jgi:hypothetical protein
VISPGEGGGRELLSRDYHCRAGNMASCQLSSVFGLGFVVARDACVSCGLLLGLLSAVFPDMLPGL